MWDIVDGRLSRVLRDKDHMRCLLVESITLNLTLAQDSKHRNVETDNVIGTPGTSLRSSAIDPKIIHWSVPNVASVTGARTSASDLHFI